MENEVGQGVICHPIGYVLNEAEEMSIPEEIASRRSRIRIEERYRPGLLGIEECERLVIVFHFHRAHEARMQLHPRDDVNRPLRGVFATRTQYRPNPVGVSVVRLVAVEEEALVVTGLDALNGTPVLDIKPFAAAFDE